MLDVPVLLAAVSPDSPCGDDLEYDAAFLELERIAQGQPERQMGDAVLPAEPPEWPRVRALASELFGRSKDLRVANLLLQSNVALDGLDGLADGLLLVRELLGQYWDGVYPLLDADDDNDPTFRINALTGLVAEPLLQLVWAIPLVRSRAFGPVNLRAALNAAGLQRFASETLSPEQIAGAFADADADALAELFVKTEHPFLQHLLAHRDATKLKQTVVGLLKTVADDGRIHTTFQQTIAATGRLSSTDPNLQNIPIRTEAGRRIRRAFVVGEGYETLMTADYSQIEMRIMAHLSGDKTLIAAFQNGEDVHRRTAAEVFGIAPENVSPEQRRYAKTINFGLIYGMGQYGLAKSLGIDNISAKNFIDRYFARYPGARISVAWPRYWSIAARMAAATGSAPLSAAAASSAAAFSTWARCASQRACASAYCFSHASRCDS